LDTQGNVAESLEIPQGDELRRLLSPDLCEPLDQVIIPSGQEHLDVIRSDKSTAALKQTLAGLYILADALEPHRPELAGLEKKRCKDGGAFFNRQVDHFWLITFPSFLKSGSVFDRQMEHFSINKYRCSTTRTWPSSNTEAPAFGAIRISMPGICLSNRWSVTL
jgi:hypothetical protein